MQKVHKSMKVSLLVGWLLIGTSGVAFMVIGSTYSRWQGLGKRLTERWHARLEAVHTTTSLEKQLVAVVVEQNQAMEDLLGTLILGLGVWFSGSLLIAGVPQLASAYTKRRLLRIIDAMERLQRQG